MITTWRHCVLRKYDSRVISRILNCGHHETVQYATSFNPPKKLKIALKSLLIIDNTNSGYSAPHFLGCVVLLDLDFSSKLRKLIVISWLWVYFGVLNSKNNQDFWGCAKMACFGMPKSIIKPQKKNIETNLAA